ncbi:MAG: hypothetical protein QOE51_1325 [Actinoplanes sp.]|jgi:hypothetical protein|nr:hypothetical protein [Actinoplanes sp.]
MTPDDLRVAAVFDGEADGVPFFTPDRVRVIDPDGRAALVRYLTGAPLVVRAPGLEADPLDPGRGPAVPVGYRSDGVWVKIMLVRNDDETDIPMWNVDLYLEDGLPWAALSAAELEVSAAIEASGLAVSQVFRAPAPN